MTLVLIKKVLHACLGSYHYWKVFYIDLPQEKVDLPKGITVLPIFRETLAESKENELRGRSDFGGPGSRGFGLYVDGQLATIQWYWWGDRYVQERDGLSWALSSTEIKSVGLFTLPAFRGQGYASMLKCYTAHEVGKDNFTRIYSRIWHSHSASIAVSLNAGWKKAGSYIQIFPLGRRFSFQVPF